MFYSYTHIPETLYKGMGEGLTALLRKARWRARWLKKDMGLCVCVLLLTECNVIFCRHAIAVIHFNKNLSREKRIKNGIEQYNVVYPNEWRSSSPKCFSQAKLW